MLRVLIFLAMAAGSILLPYFAPSMTGPASAVLVFVMLAAGLNLELGLAGLPDFALAAYCAIGAYCDALLTREFGWPFWTCLPVAGILAAAIALLLTSPLLRLKREAFAMITLGFAAVFQIVLVHGTGVVHSGTLSLSSASAGSFHYYVVLAAVMITGAVSWLMRSSPLGLALRAAREDELACLSIGLAIRSCQQIVVAFTALAAGLAGCLLAAGQGFVKPGDFDFGMTASLFAIVVLGGKRTQLGIVCAATVVAGIPQIFPAASEFRLAVCGACLMFWPVVRTVLRSRPARRDKGAWKFGTIIEMPAE